MKSKHTESWAQGGASVPTNSSLSPLSHPELGLPSRAPEPPSVSPCLQLLPSRWGLPLLFPKTSSARRNSHPWGQPCCGRCDTLPSTLISQLLFFPPKIIKDHVCLFLLNPYKASIVFFLTGFFFLLLLLCVICQPVSSIL